MRASVQKQDEPGNNYVGVKPTIFENKRNATFVDNFRTFLSEILSSKKSNPRTMEELTGWLVLLSECRFKQVREGALEMVRSLLHLDLASKPLFEMVCSRTQDVRKYIRALAFGLLLEMVQKGYNGLSEVFQLMNTLDTLDLVKYVQSLSYTNVRAEVLVEYAPIILKLCFSESQ